MPLFPKVRFRWKEPKEYLRMKDALEDPEFWPRFRVSMICAAMLMGFWFMSRYNPKVEDPLTLWQALVVSIGGGFFFAYGIPWLNRRVAGEVKLFEGSILRMRGDSHWGKMFSEIETFRWDTRDGYATLTLVPRGCGRELQVGVPLDVSREAVSRLLLDHGIWQEGKRAGRAVSI